MPPRRGGLAECRWADRHGDLSAFQGWAPAWSSAACSPAAALDCVNIFLRREERASIH